MDTGEVMDRDAILEKMEGYLTDPWTRAKYEGKPPLDAFLERFPPLEAWLYHGYSPEDIEGYREQWPGAVKRWLDWTASGVGRTLATPAAVQALGGDASAPGPVKGAVRDLMTSLLVAHTMLEENTETYRGDAAGNLIALLFCGRVHTVHKVNDQTIWCITDGGWTEGYDVTTLLTPSDY